MKQSLCLLEIEPLFAVNRGSIRGHAAFFLVFFLTKNRTAKRTPPDGGSTALDAEGVVQQLGQTPVLRKHDDALMLQAAQVTEGEGGGAGAVQPLGQGVVPVADEKDALVHHQLIAQVGQVAGDVHEAEVGDVAGGQVSKLGDRSLMEDHLDVRILAHEGGEDVRQKGGAPPGGYPDAQLLPLLGLEGPQVALQLPVQIALTLQIGVEQLPRRSELERGVGAVQQSHPQVGLQLGQILAEVWLGEVEAVGGPGDAALLDDGEKIFRVFDKHGDLQKRRDLDQRLFCSVIVP